jgi:CO/xanthine dehydrogenase Mo-binding subunit
MGLVLWTRRNEGIMSQKPKTKIEAKPHAAIVIQQPMVRAFSTGGGHGPEDILTEGDEKIVTKKWQGYPPKDLHLVGTPIPPLPEVAIPRYTGKAEYATRVSLPDLLHAKVLTSPHPRARVRSLDASRAERMPGVAYVLTPRNAPPTSPLREELNFQGEVVAIVAADTEDLAEDAVDAIAVEYEVLPHASSIVQVMSPNAPDLRQGRGNLAQLDPKHPQYDPQATFTVQHGDVDRAFAEADLVKEFTYSYAGGAVVPMQPCGCVAKWDGDRLTFWAHGQGIFPERDALARGLGIDPEKIRFIDKWNGGTFGAAQRAQVFYPWIAHIARMAGRPVKLVLPKDQELAHLQVKPENITKFKVGATRDGRITACQREFYCATGVGSSTTGGGRSELYLHVIPNWRERGFNYTTNAPRWGACRSNMQQEWKWAWEQMMDEMAEAVGVDPIQFRLLNVQKPGTKVSHAQGGPTVTPMPESENDALTYDSYASVEVLEEGAKAIGWERRQRAPGSSPGRFKRGIGVAMSMHHAGRVGYREGEAGFKKREEEINRRRGRGGGDEGGEGGGDGIFQAELELASDGYITLRSALPDSGTNHDTAMATVVAEILGFTTLNRMRVIWGDSELAPRTVKWNSGLTTQLQGGALFSGADQLRHNLLQRAAAALKVAVAGLQIRDGVISSSANPTIRTTFAALAKANGGVIRQLGRCAHPGSIGRAMNRGIGACFVEVEVDTWTGNWRFLRAAYCHDSGFVINPLLAEADMHGSLLQSTQLATEAMPWDKEFPGTRHYSVGYLSYRLPTIMEVPEVTNIFVNSLEPRWFFGAKGFAETTIGAVPGALANAIYNACGVRIREHPISREKILAGVNSAKRESNSLVPAPR